MTMQSHSLFHATGKAHCKTPWAKMSGTDSVRACPDCNAIAYRLDGLSEDDAAALVASHEHAPLHQLHLSRRKDGTFTTSDRQCTVLTIPCSYISEWRHAMRLVVQVFRKCPKLATSLVLMTVTPLHTLLGIPIFLVAQASKCRIIGASSDELNGHEWQPDRAEFEQFWSVVGNYMIYHICVALGFVLFIVPGFIFAARGCLGITIACLERCGPMEAFNRSLAMTEGSTKQILRYFALPALVYGLLSMVPVVLGILFALPTALHSSRIIFMLLYGVYALLPMFVILSFAPMQVSLYYRLKNRTAENAGSRPPLPEQTLPEQTLPEQTLLE